MPQTRKIATCCYCGTRAVLVLDRARHELSCSACGAPLHDMKMMPQAKAEPVARPAPAVSLPRAKAKTRSRPDYEDRRKPYRKEKKRKRKPLTRKLFEELWDVVEDIFD